MAPLGIEQYQALVEHGPTMVWRTGIDGKRDYFNATWLAFTGRSMGQEIGDGWIEGVHPEDVRKCLEIHGGHFDRRQPFELEYRLRRFDAVYRYVFDRGVPYADAAGAFGGFVGSSVDVDDRRALEEYSSANALFEMSLDNLCVAGLDGYFKRVNPSWTSTLGWSAEELMSRPSLEFVHPEDREATLAARQQLATKSAMGPLTNRYRCKDGTYRWFEWSSVAHVARGLVYAAARDITEQKLAEESLLAAKELQETLQRQLIFADRMTSVGTLAAGVAHEINNPLASVTANIAMLVEDLRTLGAESPPERFRELGEMAIEAQKGAERIGKIVRGLTTFSRLEEERRTAIDVRPVLELSVDLAMSEIRQRARLVKDYGETPLVEADDARLGQVFINLLINAAQALPEDRSLENEVRVVTHTNENGRAVVEIRDTGPGIPAAIIGRIFDPFFTTKPVGIGTGLGLFICHHIVSGMGGEITVESKAGRGTTFRVVLPAALPGRKDAAAAAGSSPGATRRAAVLVVDDEPSVGLVLKRVLRDHEVTVLTTAKEALELLGSGRCFDVILSDLMMPEMSGMDFYEQLTKRFPESAGRVIFVSGGAFTPIASAFLDRVANERIQKPFDAQRVRDAVQRFVR